jgi:hypothetical protein
MFVWACRKDHQIHKQNKAAQEWRAAQAAKEAEEKSRREAEKVRDEEKKRIAAAAAAAAAMVAARAAAIVQAQELSQSVGRLRIEVSVRLARDVVQGAMDSAIHAARMNQLAQRNQTEPVIARLTRVVESAIAHALVECELNKDRRLLSLMALNPDALPPPSLHIFCRTGVIAAATDVLGPFLRTTVANDAAAVLSNGVGVEDVEDAELAMVLLPASSSAASSAERDQLAAATEAPASVIQLECKQFAAAWLTSTEAALREPLKRPPSHSDQQRDAAGPWKAALALPSEPTPATDGDTAAAAAAGAGIAADAEADSNSKLNSNSGQSLPACASPSAPPAPSDSAAAVPLASELRLRRTAGTSAVGRC